MLNHQIDHQNNNKLQQNNQSQQPSTFNISPKKGQNQRQRSSPASTYTTTSLNNILAIPNNK